MSSKYVLISYAIALAIELVAIIQLFDGVFEEKIKTSYKWLLGIGLMVINFLVLVFLYNIYSNIVVHFLLVFVLSLFSYSCNTKSAFLLSFYYTALMFTTEFLAMSLLFMSDEGDFSLYRFNSSSHLIQAIFGKLFLLIAAKMSVPLCLYISKRKTKDKTPMFLFVFPVCSLMIIHTFWNIAAEAILPQRVQMTIIISGLAAVLSVVLTYIFYSKTSKELDELHEKERETDRIKSDAAYYALLDRQNKILNAFIEEEQNHLQTIKKLANSEDVNEYIERIYDEIQPKNGGGRE